MQKWICLDCWTNGKNKAFTTRQELTEHIYKAHKQYREETNEKS